jgi:hypothetical protein
MLRKFLFGSVWWVALCLLVLVIGSVILSGMLPHDATGGLTDDGRLMARFIGGKLLLPIFMSLAGFVFVASRRGWLPGTRTGRRAP